MMNRVRTGVARLIGGDAIAAPGRSPSSAYMRGGRGVTFMGWQPQLRSSQEDIGQSWDQATARAIDAIHNSGWLSGAIEQAVANTVGTGLRLKPQPENNLFGMSDAEARDWIKLVERRWELWSKNPQECDIEGRRTIGQMQAATFQQWLGTGEILAEIGFKLRPWNTCGTKVRILSPTRLSRRSSPMERLINGVFTDANGMAIGYATVRNHTLFGEIERRARARDSYGRAVVVHVFTGLPETFRGISPLAPVLQVVRQFDQLSDATLMASIVQTLFAATITSDGNTEEVMRGLLTEREQAEMARDGLSSFEAYSEMVAGYYDNATLDVGINGRLAHLFPGQELNFHGSSHPNDNYTDYSKTLMREIARCLGLLYESATGDYQGATYASLGRGLAEIYEVTKLRRSHVVVPLVQPIYEAWLEEEIQNESIPFPGGLAGFLNNRTAASRALWRGGPKPIAEEAKLSRAHETWFRLGAMSEQMICNDLGVDYEDVVSQRAEAKAIREDYGVDDPLVMQAHGGVPVDIDGEDDDEGDGGSQITDKSESDSDD